MLIQKITGKILSIFFRLIIILFGLSIILNRDNYFNLYWYFIFLGIYVFIYYLTLFKDGYISKIRLLNDYTFILLILYGKGVDPTTICYLILPIINTPNHTGKKTSLIQYVFFVICLYVISEYQFRWSFILITLVLITINFIVERRKRFFNNITNINTVIEKFFEKDLELRQSYKIYDDILDVLNNIKVLFFYKPIFSDVICLKILGSNFKIENSSSFVWSYEISKFELLSLSIKKEDDFYEHSNIYLKINDNYSPKNFCVFNKTKKNNYVFIFGLKKSSNKLFNLYYINLLKPITARISRVLDLEETIEQENKMILKEFREKYIHMQNAEKAMHFIRNRFNTLDNFIAMSKDNIAGEMDEEDMLMYKTELERLERNYLMLTERVSIILNKSKKPFSVTQLEKKPASYLFSIIREIWLDYFERFTFDLNWELKEIYNIEINVNKDGLFILLTDWINNLNIHSLYKEKVLFDENEEFLIVTFENIFNINSLNDLKELRDDFNSIDRDRILKRTSHGVIIMKSILEEMLVNGKILLNENEKIIKFQLFFKKFNQNENSNIRKRV